MATEPESPLPVVVAEHDEGADASTPPGGSVRLHNLTVRLDSDVGEVFIADCSRNTEGVLSDLEFKTKYDLSDEEWEQLGSNAPLLHAIRAERERRIFNGEAPREAAQLHFAKAPNVLNRILTDEQIAPRHRIEAARELRQVAGNGPDIAPGPKEKFVIEINLGADEKFVYETEISPRGPALPDEGERS